MLKTVDISRNRKTGPIAVTYRAGKKDTFGTCPKNCEMNASGAGCSVGQIDFEYLDAVLESKPRRGFGWTYSHFHPLFWAGLLAPNKTVINYSAKNLAEAVAAFANQPAPVVTVVPESMWKGAKHITASRDDIPDSSVRVVRCLAEYNDKINCANCGDGEKGPLCARLNRDFIVGFSAHGNGKKKAADDKEQGGCYAAGGPTRLQWNATAKQAQTMTDAAALRAWFKTLPHNAIIRHHIAGDLGEE